MAQLPPGLHIADIARDPLWFPHRYDPGHDAVQFRALSRADHRAATFLTDDYLGAGDIVPIVRTDAMAARPARAPLHFIFHSAFCCSTVLARALDVPGVAMGLKEPAILNDIVGWQHRGSGGAQLGPVLDAALTLLARPFAPAEAVVIKPSNVVNGFATAMMQLVPGARALLLHAPLPVYLGSIARKGMTGRLWVRDLLTKQLKEGQHRFGFSGDDYLGQTDLQVAAMGWLAQQALFAGMAARFEGRVACIDSESLMANPLPAMTGLARLFGLALDVPAIVAGPAFTRHSKSGTAFSAEDRLAVQALEAAHADEIAKVTAWTLAVAQASGVPMDLPRPLIA